VGGSGDSGNGRMGGWERGGGSCSRL
jgi:hypothetical protein